MIAPVDDMNMPLSSRDIDAIALRPIRSCSAIRSKHAGNIVVALSENMTNGEMPRPCTLRETAS